ncbi:MAG: hypothetical protein ACHREM_29340 [Polyangiales bacterium]
MNRQRAKKTLSKRAPTQSRLVARRDSTGHLEPHYAANLLARTRHSSAPPNEPAFIDGATSDDAFVEHLGEGFVTAATSGEDVAYDPLDGTTPSDVGGALMSASDDLEGPANDEAPIVR